jgi:hypothetical protein
MNFNVCVIEFLILSYIKYKRKNVNIFRGISNIVTKVNIKCLRGWTTS